MSLSLLLIFLKCLWSSSVSIPTCSGEGRSSNSLWQRLCAFWQITETYLSLRLGYCIFSCTGLQCIFAPKREAWRWPWNRKIGLKLWKYFSISFFHKDFSANTTFIQKKVANFRTSTDFTYLFAYLFIYLFFISEFFSIQMYSW